jgi:hypothetical protein
MPDDATGKILAAQFFLSKLPLAISACFVSCCVAMAFPSLGIGGAAKIKTKRITQFTQWVRHRVR